MSAHRILGCSRSQGLGCSPIKAVRELGSERRDSSVPIRRGRRNLRGAVLSTRTGMDAPLVYQLFCQGHRWVASADGISAESI